MRQKPEIESLDLDVSLRDTILRVSEIAMRAPTEEAHDDLRAVVAKNRQGFEAIIAKLTESA